jgi:peptidoglycan/LPS O-acetylase OafA/YrhL
MEYPQAMSAADIHLARRPALDGVRAVAILLVLAGHFIGIPGLAVAGVVLFFVLSGYLITSLLDLELERTGQIRLGRFYWRRACRIIPAYVVWVVVTWLLLGDWSQPGDRSALTGLLTYTYNYTRPTAYGFNSIIHPAWSLAVEEQFYLLWPLGLLMLGPKRARGSLLAFFAVVVAWRLVSAEALHLPSNYLAWSFEANAGCLALGCWLALQPKAGRPMWWMRFAKPAWPTVMVGIALSSVALGLQDVAGAAVWAVPLAAVVMFLMMSATLQSDQHPLLSHPFLRWIGAISYPLYLWHLWGLAIGESLPIPHAIQLVIASAASVALASASYYLLERPILRWRDAGWTRLPASPAAAP